MKKVANDEDSNSSSDQASRPMKQHRKDQGSASPSPDFIYDPIHDKRHDLGQLAPSEKKPKPLWKRLLIWFLVLGVIVGIGYLAFSLKTLTKVAPNFFKFNQKLKGEDEGRVNILLVGVGDPGHDGATLADTNILVSVNTRDKKVALTSIPRDTRVKIPGSGFAKINNANAYGDIPLARQTVENFLGVPIHYYVRTDFTGLKQAVDAVGGIQIVNKDFLSDPEYPCDKNQWKSCGFSLKPGTYQADGTLALKYARCRKGTCGDDFGRAARQQEVLSGIRSKALSAGTILNPGKLTALIQAAGDNIKTDLSVSEMLQLNDITKEINNDQFINIVFSLKPNGFLASAPDGSSDLVPVDATLKSIQNFEKDIFRLGPIWIEEPRLVIENGTKTPGLGGKLEAKITKSSLPITILPLMNATKTDYEKTVLYDYSDGKKNDTRAYLEDLLKVQVSPLPSPVKNPAQDFVIIIGSDYANYLPTPTPKTTP